MPVSSSPRSLLGGLGDLRQRTCTKLKLARHRSLLTHRKRQAPRSSAEQKVRREDRRTASSLRPDHTTSEQPSSAVSICCSARDWRAMRGGWGGRLVPNGSGKRKRMRIESSARPASVKSRHPAPRFSAPAGRSSMMQFGSPEPDCKGGCMQSPGLFGCGRLHKSGLRRGR